MKGEIEGMPEVGFETYRRSSIDEKVVQAVMKAIAINVNALTLGVRKIVWGSNSQVQVKNLVVFCKSERKTVFDTDYYSYLDQANRFLEN